jgi:hypothetical protein
MRVTILTASLMLTSAMVMLTAPAPAFAANQCKVVTTCSCDCPAPAKTRHARRKASRRVARHAEYYDYAAAAPVRMGGWHGAWRVARQGYVAPMAAPVYYGPPPAYGPPPGYGPPPPGYYDSEMGIDDRGFDGGVGYGYGDGGGGGGFGQLHFGLGGSVENGPNYNSYNQSFQYNPSQAGPFQNRLMGGLAPSK